MRKILASFLAASMVASIGATMTFAADNAKFTITMNSAMNVEDTTAESATTAKLAAGSAKLTAYADSGEKFVFSSTRDLDRAASHTDIAEAFNGATARANIDGIMYTLRMEQDSTDHEKLNVTVSPAGLINFTLSPTVDVAPYASAATDNGKVEIYGTKPAAALVSSGSGGVLEDNDDNRDYVIGQILYTHGDTPVALVEDADLINDNNDGVKSGSTVYFLLNEPYSDPDLFKVRVTKGENAKNIKSISVVEKRFGKDLVEVNGSRDLAPVAGKRLSAVKVELKELYTDDEYKITFDLRVSPTSRGAEIYKNFSTQSFKESDIGTVWLKNSVVDADNEFRVGTKGLMLNPIANDDNEIVWYNEQDDLARLRFFADSDVSSFYSKLSTKWEHQDYAAYFNDQDAFLFQFTGSPKISSTSRGTLDIYNPYIDEDGNETVDPDSIIIYEIVDGELIDVTKNFTYDETDDGYMAFTTKTRFLGTYVFAEKAVEQASKDETPSDEQPKDEQPQSPETGNGTKVPANTGRYA